MNKLTKEEKIEIKTWKKAKDYEAIYNKYGMDEYLAAVCNTRYSSKDRKKLKKEKRYMDLQTKYGDGVIEDKICKIMYDDVLNETGSKLKAFLYSKGLRIKKSTKTTINYSLFIALLFVGIFRTKCQIIPEVQKLMQYDDLKAYEADVDQYLLSKDYSNYSDLEIFMDLMNDMWNKIDGYQYPENQSDIVNCERLYLYQNNYGVCRNFADDLAYRLNLINSDYNARCVPVYLLQEPGDGWSASNMNFHHGPGYQEEKHDGEYQAPSETDKLFANHSIVFVDIKDKDITLILDPTNCGMGVLIDGEIKMFNSRGVDELICEVSMFIQRDTLETIKLFTDEKRSNDIDYSYDELDSLYGLEAQNNALELIKTR